MRLSSQSVAPITFSANKAPAIQNVAFGELKCAEARRKRPVRVAPDRVGEVKLLDELSERVRVVVNADAENHHAMFPHLLRERFQARRFVHAGRAPRAQRFTTTTCPR